MLTSTAKASKGPRRQRRWVFPVVFIAPALIVLAVVNFVPLFYTIYGGFEDHYLPRAASRHLVGLANYAEILRDSRFWNSMSLTGIFVSVSLTLQVMFGFIIALLLFRQRRGLGIIRGAILMPILLTPIAIAFLWRLLFSPSLGLLNYLLSIVGIAPLEWIYNPYQALPAVILVDVWHHTPTLVLIIFTGLLTLPDDLMEAATIDGASAWSLFWWVKLPLLMPILMVGVLFRIIDLFKTFDVIYILTRGGPGISTETLALYTFTNAFGFLRMGYGSALATILFVVVLLISILVMRLGKVRFD